MNDKNPFDISEFFATPESLAPRRKPSKTERQREFVKLPWVWVARLQSAKRVSTWRLAVLLLYRHWWLYERLHLESGDVPLSNILARDVGLDPRAKSRGLQELQELELIEASRRK